MFEDYSNHQDGMEKASVKELRLFGNVEQILLIKLRTISKYTYINPHDDDIFPQAYSKG